MWRVKIKQCAKWLRDRQRRRGGAVVAAGTAAGLASAGRLDTRHAFVPRRGEETEERERACSLRQRETNSAPETEFMPFSKKFSSAPSGMPSTADTCAHRCEGLGGGTPCGRAGRNYYGNAGRAPRAYPTILVLEQYDSIARRRRTISLSTSSVALSSSSSEVPSSPPWSSTAPRSV